MRGMLQSPLSAVTTKPAFIIQAGTGVSCNTFDPAVLSDLKPISGPDGTETRPSTSLAFKGEKSTTNKRLTSVEDSLK